MLLLDIISPDEEFRRIRRPIRRIIRDTIQSNPHSADTVPVPDTVAVDSISADTLNSVADTLNTLPGTADTISANQTLMNTFGMGGVGSSTLLWSIAIVLLALGLCLYFAIVYRRSTLGVK